MYIFCFVPSLYEHLENITNDDFKLNKLIIILLFMEVILIVPLHVCDVITTNVMLTRHCSTTQFVV